MNNDKSFWRIFILVSAFVGIYTAAFAQKAAPFEQFDLLFTQTSFDTLHLYPSLFKENATSSKHIDSQLYSIFIDEKVQQTKFEVKEYRAFFKFNLSQDKEYTAYVLAEHYKSSSTVFLWPKVYLVILDKQTHKIIKKHTLTFYFKDINTHEALKNTWLVKISNNNALQLISTLRLTDYTLATDANENISGNKVFLYVFDKGVFRESPWENNLPEKIKK